SSSPRQSNCRKIRRQLCSAQAWSGEQQSNNRFRVFDFALANHLKRAIDGYPHDFDELIILKALRSLGKVGREIQPHLLFAESRRDKKLRKLFESSGAHAQLFFQLARSAVLGTFLIVQSPSRQLQEILHGGMTILPHERNRAVIEGRQDHGAARMMNDFANV